MSKFILKFNNEVVDHIDIAQGDMKIGRRPGLEIHLDNLAVSGEHANVFTIGEDSFIEDLGSTNGTLINNKKITKHHLKNGDSVVIGKHELVYVADSGDGELPASENDFAKTVIIGPGSMPSPAAEAVTSAKGSQEQETRKGAIFVLSGANSGKRIDLIKQVTSLGRTGKKAGTITAGSEGYTLAPVSGSDENPTLNGRQVPASGALLKNGDIIEVAGTRLQFYYK
ncbi:MAG: FHA domain-containing protein [Acidiferrobacterales bacterium]|jgi:pSer/pThr/pTyr-binding forkhead associated (FHA) protein|nr:FHA domain-containing protein [Acidiferrobacterales bacterium]